MGNRLVLNNGQAAELTVYRQLQDLQPAAVGLSDHSHLGRVVQIRDGCVIRFHLPCSLPLD
jgi:hypothetical protein